MLPASALAAISNVVALNLEPSITTAVLGALLTPLLQPDPAPVPNRKIRQKRARSKPRKAARQKRKYRRRVPTEARERAIAALRKAGPGATPTEIAKAIGVSRGTMVNASKQLAREERRQARKAARETSMPEPRQRAKRFLKDTLADGPKSVADVEERAERAHVSPQALEQARGDLGIRTSRGNAGGVQAVQWSLPA